MTFIKRLIIVSSSILLFSCSSLSYEEPQTGDRSRVRLVTDTSYLTIVWGYETEQCGGESEWMRLRKGDLLNSSPKSLGIPLNDFHKNASKEVYITSGHITPIMFKGVQTIGNTEYRCGVLVSHNFEKDKDYELSFSGGISNCSVDVSLITRDAVREKITTFTNIVSSNTPEQCVKAFHKVGLY